MQPIDLPPRSILLREKVRQARFHPPDDAATTKGMEDCGILEVLIEPADEENALPRLHSFWEPTEEEWERMKQGEPIRITVWGNGLAPMSVSVGY